MKILTGICVRRLYRVEYATYLPIFYGRYVCLLWSFESTLWDVCIMFRLVGSLLVGTDGLTLSLGEMLLAPRALVYANTSQATILDQHLNRRFTSV